MTNGTDPNQKADCPYGADPCPKLLEWKERYIDDMTQMKKDIEFLKRLTIVLAAIVLGSDGVAMILG